MPYLVGGLLLFFTVHFIAVSPALRRAVVSLSGENAWKGFVAVASFGAIVLIVAGWPAASSAPLFASSLLVVRFAPWLVSVALVLIVIGGANLPGHVRQRLRHPMLIGFIIWSATHLLANGGLRETLLFGAFFAFSLYALAALLLAGKRASFVPAWKWDVLGVGIGLFGAVGVMHGHRWLFGVAVM